MIFASVCLAWYILEVVIFVMLIAPCSLVDIKVIGANWKRFFACREFAQYMKVSMLNT